MSQADIAPTRKRFRSGPIYLGAMVVVSGLLAAWIVPSVQNARNAARESQLL